ncbi:MAG: glycosyltransferase family 4 protein [Patescibacteria group bacterium]
MIYFNLRGSATSGGPTVSAYRLANGFAKKGHSISYDKPHRADKCLCIIESGKALRQVDRKKTKIYVRLDGAYFREYWHGGPGRERRSDMDALHNAIKRDVANVDHMIYQSEFSKRLIDSEIAERKENFSIIHNGADINTFCPKQRKFDGFVNIFSHGVMRNDYIMESLIGAYEELKSRNHKVKLIMVGVMDSQCQHIYNKYKLDKNIIYHGSIPNSKISKYFENADIGLYPRMGSSCDNSVIESISSGIPVIIPLWGGNSELISDRKQGIIVDSGGHWNYGSAYIKKLADGIESVIPNLAEFKQQARGYAVKELTLDKMINRYLKAMGL